MDNNLHKMTVLDDIYEAIKPLYYLSKIFGLAPFSCVTEVYHNGVRRKTFKISFFNICYSALIIVVLLIASIIILSWRIRNSYKIKRPMTVILTDSNVFCLNSLLALVSVVMAVASNTRQMLKLVTQIPQIDKVLLSKPGAVYKKTYIFALLQVAYLLCIYVAFYCYHSWVWVGELNSKNFQHLPVSYFIRSIIYTVETQYINIILLLKQRFREINIFLKGMYEKQETDLIHKLELHCGYDVPDSAFNLLPHRAHTLFTTRRVKQSGPLEIKISTSRDQSNYQRELMLMRGIHYELCDLASSVDRMYGLQILMDFAVSFITLTTCIYFCINFTTQLQVRSEVSVGDGVTRALIISVVWASLVAFRLISVTAACSSTSAEANHSINILQRILLEPGLHPYTLRIARMFLQQVTSRPLYFTAWGFFTINYTALGSFIGSVVTYLVILLQV